MWLNNSPSPSSSSSSITWTSWCASLISRNCSHQTLMRCFHLKNQSVSDQSVVHFSAVTSLLPCCGHHLPLKWNLPPPPLPTPLLFHLQRPRPQRCINGRSVPQGPQRGHRWPPRLTTNSLLRLRHRCGQGTHGGDTSEIQRCKYKRNTITTSTR